MIAFLLFVLMIASGALAAFCAGAETGFLSLSRGRVLHLAREGSKTAKILSSALAELPRTMTSLLIGNNLAAVTFSSASAALCARLFPGSAVAKALWSFAAALVMLYLCEFLPKLLCSARPLHRMLPASRFYKIFNSIFGPAGGLMTRLISLFLPRAAPRDKVTMADLLRILEDRKDGVRLTDFESALISRILVLRNKGRSVTSEELFRVIDDDEEE